MAPRVKKQDNDDDGPAHGSNVPDGEKVMEFIARIENIEDQKASERGEYMARCKVLNDDKDEVFKEAKASGLKKKALKTVLKQRELERKLKAVGEDLEGEDSDAFASMSLALEKMGALGQWAMADKLAA